MTPDLGPRYAELVRELERRIVVIDGAMGTLLQAHGLSEDDYPGERRPGRTVEAFWTSVQHVPLLAVGLNCALGPREMRAHVEELAGLTPCFVSAYPNAGLPTTFGGFDGTPESMARDLGEWARSGFVNFVGGWCGTTPG